MTLANKITILRILLIPVFIITLLYRAMPWPGIIFTCTIVTDALDGFIARSRKQTTPLGSFLDPLADKLLMLSSFLTLAYLGDIPLWAFITILSRDILIVTGWALVYFITDSTEIKPRALGKITTIAQMLTAWFIVLGLPAAASGPLLTGTIILTVISGLDYIWAGSRRLNSHA